MLYPENIYKNKIIDFNIYEQYIIDYIKTNYISDKLFEIEKFSKDFKISRKKANKYKNKINIHENNSDTKELKFLSEIELYYNISLIKQYKIENYYVDGICLENFQNISNSTVPVIFEFLGDYLHGNLELFDEEQYNNATKCYMKDLYIKTFNRFNELKSLGYRIFYIWENEYDNYGIYGIKEYKN